MQTVYLSIICTGVATLSISYVYHLIVDHARKQVARKIIDTTCNMQFTPQEEVVFIGEIINELAEGKDYLSAVRNAKFLMITGNVEV